MPMFFSVLAGIIPLSLRNGGGIWYRLPPLSASGGQLPPRPSPRLRRLWLTDGWTERIRYASWWCCRRAGCIMTVVSWQVH